MPDKPKAKPVKAVLIAMTVVYLIIWLICFLSWGRGYPESVATTDTYKSVLANDIVKDDTPPPAGVDWGFLAEFRVRAGSDEKMIRRFQREYETWLVELSSAELVELSEKAKAEATGLPAAAPRAVKLGLFADWAKRRVAEAAYAGYVTWLNVAVLVFLFTYFGWGPMKGYLEERGKRIERDLDAAQGDREQAQGAFLEIRKKLENFDRTKQETLADAKRTADAEEQRIALETELAQKRLDAAEEEFTEIEHLRARQNFGDRIVIGACAGAKTVLAENVTKDDQERLVNKFLTEFEAFSAHFQENAS